MKWITMCKAGRWPVQAVLLLMLAVAGLSIPVMVLAEDKVVDMDFDHLGWAIFKSYDSMPDGFMTADSGDRNLNSYYDLRQYPGSPPAIPHKVETSFSDANQDCLACHGKGGYSPEMGKFIPVTPHPDKESCRQCHVPKPVKDLFLVENIWRSISPPRLGRSAMGGSPPIIPHSLQMRENCLACHTGPGAVVEIRVEHSTRGNCRQCHMPVINTQPVLEFVRNTK